MIDDIKLYRNTSNNIDTYGSQDVDVDRKNAMNIIHGADLSSDPTSVLDWKCFSRNFVSNGQKSIPYMLIQPVSIWDEMDTSKLAYLNRIVISGTK